MLKQLFQQVSCGATPLPASLMRTRFASSCATLSWCHRLLCLDVWRRTGLFWPTRAQRPRTRLVMRPRPSAPPHSCAPTLCLLARDSATVPLLVATRLWAPHWAVVADVRATSENTACDASPPLCPASLMRPRFACSCETLPWGHRSLRLVFGRRAGLFWPTRTQRPRTQLVKRLRPSTLPRSYAHALLAHARRCHGVIACCVSSLGAALGCFGRRARNVREHGL